MKRKSQSQSHVEDDTKKYKKGDRIIFKWIEQNYWIDHGKTKATPHPVERLVPGTFDHYRGNKQAYVFLEKKQGGRTVGRVVKLKYLLLASEAASQKETK